VTQSTSLVWLCVLALGLTVLGPLWLLLLAPLLFGVPHVFADLRYLVFARPESSVAFRLALSLPLAVLTLVRLVVVLGGARHPVAEGLLGVAAVAGALLSTKGFDTRRVVALLLTAVLALAIGIWPGVIAIVLGHLHNLVAIGLWLAWRRTPAAGVAGVTSVFGLCAAILALGVLDPVSVWAGAFRPRETGLDLGSLASTLAPGCDATVAFRLVLLFAFAQAIHYAVWLVLLPSAAQSALGSRRSWNDDLGRPLTLVAVGLTLAVVAAGTVSPVQTRAVYLSLVLFHGWLEIAVLSRWAVDPTLAPWTR
jgi:hypothetical protein